MNGSRPETKGSDLNSLIAKYSAELMSYYQHNASRILPAEEDAPAEGAAAAIPVFQEDRSKDAGAAPSAESEPEAIIAYPARRVDPPATGAEEPDMPLPPEPAPGPPLDSAEAGNREQLLEEAEEAPYEELPEPEYELPEEERTGDIGYLHITAYAGRTAQPVMNAYVTVSRPEPDGSTRLYWLALTDRDGNTPPLPLPTISRNSSLHPGVSEPYLSYNVQVDATGYYTVRNLNVPIYGGISANQPVEMIPLPEQTPNGELVFPESGPQDLD